MNKKKKRSILNRMNFAAQLVKLGDEFLFSVSKQLTESDISSGKAAVDTGFDYTTVCSVLITAPDGTVRTVSKIEKSGTSVKATASGAAAADTITVTVK